MPTACASPRGLSKSLYLVMYAAIGAVLPFLSIYLKFLGMRADQIGAIIGVRPLVSAIVCPVWGWIADRYRCRKPLALISVLCWIIFVTYLFLCPLLADLHEQSERNGSSHVTNRTGFSDVTDHVRAEKVPFFKRQDGDWPWGTEGKIDKEAYEQILASLKGKTDKEKYEQIKASLKGKVTNSGDGKPQQQAVENTKSTVSNRPTESVSKWPTTEVSMTTEKPVTNQSRSEISEDKPTKQETRFIFIILLVGFGAMQIFLAPVFSIADAVALQSLGPDTSHWGRQRMMGSFGYGLSCGLVGLVLTQVVPKIGPAHIDAELKRFLPGFCIAQLFLLLAFVVATRVRFNMTDLRCHEYKVTLVTKMMTSCSYGSYIATGLYFGVAMGSTWTFLYWHLHNIGASYSQLGMATLASSAGEAIGFMASPRLVNNYGCAAMMTVALGCYSLRFLIYGFLTQPWYAVPTEVLQGTSFSLVWSASTFSICGSTPNKALASITGILYGILAGIGLAIGCHLSGLLVRNYGAPVTFIYFAFLTLCVMLVFLVTHLAIQRPNVQPDFPAEFSVSAPDLEKLHVVDDSDDSEDIWAQS